MNCPVWTASQTNRSGLNAEVVTMEQISEAFNKCFVADFICTLSRTIEDKQNNKAKMFIARIVTDLMESFTISLWTLPA